VPPVSTTRSFGIAATITRSAAFYVHPDGKPAQAIRALGARANPAFAPSTL
jgi:hypothetical protein